MRIVSNNILDGGEGRADPLAEVVEAQRPDVVALVEATDLSVVQRMARRLQFDYIQAPGRKQASALLTRYTIRHSVNHALLDLPLTKSLLEACVIDGSGEEWTFGVLHLHSRAYEADEAIREREIVAVLEVFQPQRAAQRPHILCGDFNANSPIQQIAPRKCKKSTREAWEANGGQIPRRVVQTILDAGYIDTLHAVRGVEATSAATFTTQFPGQRVDYIFTHSIHRSRLKQAWIEHDRLAKYASDHFPVGVEIA
jgi:endonuclease/exonuclease/phosphatase family metal-dependent hydrolase